MGVQDSMGIHEIKFKASTCKGNAMQSLHKQGKLKIPGYSDNTVHGWIAKIIFWHGFGWKHNPHAYDQYRP